MRAVRSAVIIAPIAGSGQHVFRPEARRLAALYSIPESRIILFDQSLPPAARFRFVCAAIVAIVASLPAGELIDSIIILCHGWRTGDQIGATNSNLPVFFAAFGGRLSARVVVAFYSCSNGADTSVGPGGDGSFADTARDVLCRIGFVWCQTFGHLVPGHATMLALARWFRGDGSPTGGIGGIDVLGRLHPLYPLLKAELRKATDPDGPGPEPMTSLRWLVPWMETEAELIARLTDTHDLVVASGRTEAPPVLELQTALKAGGFDPGDLDGVMGRRTTAAIRAFQAAHPPLKVDGDAGPRTWAALHVLGLLP